MARVTVVGTGFIGTSLGLALKARNPTIEVVGHDREYGRSTEAKRIGALDKAEWNLPAALEGASLVIIATPLSAIERLFSQMGDFLMPGAVITDTAPLKGPVIGWAQTHLSGKAHYVGGHPIVGFGDGQRKPSGDLFADRTYCVVPSPDASNEAVDQVVRLTQVVGAKALFLDPVEHDGHLAVVSQLPMIVASSMMNLAAGSASWRDGQRLAGPAFGAATSMALTDPKEHHAQLRANRDAIVRGIQALQSELTEFARLVDVGAEEELLKTLEFAQDERAKWNPGAGPAAELPPAELPRAREQFSSWFLGRLGDRGKRKN
jgi:prephenate dehydrogenase